MPIFPLFWANIDTIFANFSSRGQNFSYETTSTTSDIRASLTSPYEEGIEAQIDWSPI